MPGENGVNMYICVVVKLTMLKKYRQSTIDHRTQHTSNFTCERTRPHQDAWLSETRVNPNREGWGNVAWGTARLGRDEYTSSEAPKQETQGSALLFRDNISQSIGHTKMV